MALKATVDDLDAVEDMHRPLYEERDGKYVLQIEGVEAHPGAQSLKNALDRVRSEKREVSEKLRVAEAKAERLHGIPDDFTAETYADLVAKAERTGDPTEFDARLEKQRALDKAKLDAEVAKREETIKARERDIAKRDAALRRRLVDGGLTDALLEAGVSKEHLTLARARLKEIGKIQVVEEDEDFNVFVDDGVDDRAPLSKFVRDWIASSDEGKSVVMKPKGGDAHGGAPGRYGENPWDTQGGKVKPNLTKQQELIRTNPEKARQLAGAAGAVVSW